MSRTKEASQRISIPYVDEAATVLTYNDGYTVVLVPKKGDVFNISTWVRTGSIHEDERLNGVSHFLEHLLFKGTQRFGPGEFDHIMESMGAIINAATWKDFTFYYVTGPTDKQNENFDLALDMHADMMINSTIPDGEVGPPYDPASDYTGEKRERSVVIEEIGMREDQPFTKIYNSVNHMMYPEGHPYRRDVIGTRKIIGLIPRQDIVDYYHRWYSPQNLVTIVVGDFTPEELEAKVLKSFNFGQSALSNGHKIEPGKAITQAPSTQLPPPKLAEVPGEYQTCFFIMALHGPDPKNLRETIALDVASHALGEGRSSRRNQELVEKPATPVFNFVSCGQSTYKLGNAFYVQGNFNTPEGQTPQQVLQQVSEQIKLLTTTKPVTQAEFNRAVKKLKVQFAEASETVSGIAENIGESLTVVGNLSHYTEYLSTLETLDLETVNAVAKKYLKLDAMYQSVMVPSTESNN